MGVAAGPQFGAQNKGYEIYGFETENTDCVFIVNTEAVTPGATSFTIRTTGTCTYVVDWGDDSSETVTATTATHNYSTAGTYNVGIRVVSGTFRPYYNNNNDGRLVTKFRGRSDFKFTGSLDSAFYGCVNLDEVTADFSQVTGGMTYTFRDANSLVDFQNTGVGATVLNQNLFGFNDLRGVTYLNNTFYNCSALKTLAGLDLSNITSVPNAFYGTDLVKFGTENLPISLGTTAGNLSLVQLFTNKSSVTDFHVDSAQRVTSFVQTFYNSGLVNFGSEANPVGLGSTADNSTECSFSQFIVNNSSFREFHVDSGERISTFNTAFQNSGITTFRVGDNNLTNCDNMVNAFYGCSGLSAFGTEANPITFGSGATSLNLSSAFRNTSALTDFFITDSNRISTFVEAFSGSGLVNAGSETTPIGIGSTADNSTLCSFYLAFNNTSSLKEAHFDYGDRMSSTVQMFYTSGIGTFRIGDNKLTNCADARYMFYQSGILSFGSEANPISFGSTGSNVSLQYFAMNSTSFTDFFITDSNRITSFSEAFRGSGIVNFGSSTTPVGIGSIADNSSTCDCNTSFYQASSLKEVHFDYGERISGLQNAFTETGITTFRIGDNKLTNCNSIYNAFYQVTTFGPEFGTEANPITFGSSGSNLNFQGVFYGATSLTDFFITDSARITSFYQTFQNSGLVNFGSSTTPVGLGSTADNSSTCTFINAFNGVSALREAHLDSGERISTLQNAFQSSGITTFSVGDNNLSNCTSMRNAFIYSSLAEFPGVNLVGCTDFYQAFQQGSLVKFGTQANPVGLGSTADNSSTCSLVQAFYRTSSFKEFHVDSGDRISTLQNAFYNTGITTFRIGDNDLSNCTTLRSAFFGTPLTEFSGFNLVGCTDFHKTFQSNTALVNFGTQANPIGLGTIGDNASTCTWPDTFYGVSTLKEVHIDSGTRVGNFSASFVNTGITTFRINDTNLSSVTTMSNAFLNSALDTASIENILVSCDNGGKSSITLTLSGGSNAAKTTWTSAANTAYTNLIGKSWTITYNA